MIEDRGDTGPASPAGRRRERSSTPATTIAEPARPVHQLPRQHALALPRHRPRPGQDDGRLDRRASSTRSRSTSARSTSTTSTASAAPGRSTSRPTPTSASRSRTSSSCKVRNDRGGMVPLGTLAAVRDVSGPVMIIRYNMYPSAADQRRARRRASAPARRSTRWRSWSPAGAAPGDAVRMDRAGAACSSRPATRRCSSSCWPSCWCSSCWPPSTKAGRCRWP